jgi:threonine/homoserine/homoserine lactone efflux protein
MPGENVPVRTAVLTFTLAAALLTVTPGADTLLVLRSAMRGGRRAGALAGLGVCSGLFAWGAAAALGVSALLAASHVAYTTLRLVGAGYLVWLGLRAWRDARSGAGAGGAADENRAGGGGPAGITGWAAYRSGLLCNLANPKVGVFYVTFLPQFVPAGYPVLPVAMLFVAIHATQGVLWLGLVASAVQRARAVLSRPAVARWLGRVVGTAFIGFGARLAFAQR